MHSISMSTDSGSSHLGGGGLTPPLTRHPPPSDQTLPSDHTAPQTRHQTPNPTPPDRQMPVKTLPSPLRYDMRLVITFYICQI